MARRRFFVHEIRRGTAELTGADSEHLVRVLRVEPGQVFEISDNNKVYLAEVETARKSLVSFAVREEIPQTGEAVTTELLCSLFKLDHFEWLIEKATELGVAVISPIASTRTERGLAQASEKRRQRWERIALEASQQARRARLPEVRATIPFQSAIAEGKGTRLFLDEAPHTPALVAQLRAMPSTARTEEVRILTGPEGGWTDEERQEAERHGWTFCSLGPAVLRAETAGIAALALIQAFCRDERSGA